MEDTVKTDVVIETNLAQPMEFMATGKVKTGQLDNPSKTTHMTPSKINLKTDPRIHHRVGHKIEHKITVYSTILKTEHKEDLKISLIASLKASRNTSLRKAGAIEFCTRLSSKDSLISNKYINN